MDHVPEPVLIEIFDYLSAKDIAKCGRVCKRWNNIVYQTSNLWKNEERCKSITSYITQFLEITLNYLTKLKNRSSLSVYTN
jgi:hypothetical protein